MKKFFCLKGMNDYLPNEINIWNYIFDNVKKIIISYGYNEIKFPIIENKSLFNKSIDINNDINKQMYCLKCNKNNLVLRPEGTSICVRYGIEHGMFRGQKNKWWYFGPMFRHENTQFGRYREFYQLGIENFGYSSIATEIELMLIMKKIFFSLNLYNFIDLEINYIGSRKNLIMYKKKLINFLSKNNNFLNKNNIFFNNNKNPFNILNTKNEILKDYFLKNSPKISEFLDKNENLEFTKIKNILNKNNINFNENPLLFRGIDYYNNFIFEWSSNILKSKISICSGGRYDNLSKNLGNNIKIPSMGLAIGWNRLFLIFNKVNKLNKIFFIEKNFIDLYVTLTNDIYTEFTIEFSEKLRNIIPNIKLYVDYSISNVKNKIRYINNNNIKISLIIFKKYNIYKNIIYKNIITNEYSIENENTLLIKLKNLF